MTRASQLLLTCLANAAWQVALIAAVARVSSWLLRSTAARYRHLLWVVALSIAIDLPIATSIDFSHGYEMAAHVKNEPMIVQNPAGPSDAKSSRVSMADFGRFSMGNTVAMGLIALYLLLVLYRGIMVLRAWRCARAIARDSSPAELNAEIVTVIDECRRTLGVERFRLHQSSTIPTPVT